MRAPRPSRPARAPNQTPLGAHRALLRTGGFEPHGVGLMLRKELVTAGLEVNPVSSRLMR